MCEHTYILRIKLMNICVLSRIDRCSLLYDEVKHTYICTI